MEKKIATVIGAIVVVALVPFMAIVPGAIACTLGGVTGSIASDDGIFFGQTCDNAWWPTRHTVWVIQPEDGYKYIGTKAFIWGFWTGMNEKGFGYCGAAVGTRDKDKARENGWSRFDIGPELLKKCVTVQDAIKEFKKVKPFGPDISTRQCIIGDAKGNLALVEMSYAGINVETLTQDGYVARTNHFISDKMKELDYSPDPYYCERLERAEQWFSDRLGAGSPIEVEELFEYFGYVYLTRLLGEGSGPGTCLVMQPKELTYWFTYGWPQGNLPPKELESRQICQNMTWGSWIPFYLPEMPPGQYTTELGQLTPLGVQYLYAHFSPELQRDPDWLKYQSVDPEDTWYKPLEDVVSPDAYAPKENPYGPGGFIGTWTRSEGFKPCVSLDYVCPEPE